VKTDSMFVPTIISGAIWSYTVLFAAISRRIFNDPKNPFYQPAPVSNCYSQPRYVFIVDHVSSIGAGLVIGYSTGSLGSGSGCGWHRSPRWYYICYSFYWFEVISRCNLNTRGGNLKYTEGCEPSIKLACGVMPTL